MTDLLLTSLHHLAVFSLFGLLLAEHFLLGLPPASETLRLISRVDLAYGVTAVVVIAAGLARLFLGAKGAELFLHNHAFWAKMTVFLAIGLMSIPPTLAYFRWQRGWKTEKSLPTVNAWRQPLRWIRLQLVLFAALPVLAAMMVRGYGLN